MNPEKRGAKGIFSNKVNLENIFIGAAILLGIIVIINISIAFNLNKELSKAAETAKEKRNPAKIEIFIVKNSKCADCFDISAAVSSLKKANVNITKEEILEFDSREGRELISRYHLEKVPAAVITGEIEKINMPGYVKRENALLLANPEAPYTNAATGKIEGRVELYYLKDASCEKCSDLIPLISQIKAAGVKVYEQKIIAIGSDEGKELTKKYNIDFVPAIILSKDASAYEIIQKAWPQIGSKESDGYYVLRLANAPFINLTTGKLRGIVNIIYLTDKSCAGCYNVSIHKEILANPQSFAVTLGKEETYDISDAQGKELIEKYNITKVPTAILSDEIRAYPSYNVLSQLFSSEKDGFHVFRKLSLIGDYMDLTTKQVVKAQQQSEVQQIQ